MSVNDVQGVKPWLDYSNWTVVGKGTTQDGKEMTFYAKPSREVAAAWEDDPEYQAWLLEGESNFQKNLDQLMQETASGKKIPFNFLRSDGVFVHLDMTSEGTKQLTSEQLEYFKQKYGIYGKLTYDMKMQMYAELANLGVVHSRVAFHEIRFAETPVVKDPESGLVTKLSSNDIDELLKLIMSRYERENDDLILYRGSRTCDFIIERSQTKYVEGLYNLHEILRSIFDR